MKNLKRLLGLMAISGFAFGFAGNVKAEEETVDNAKACDKNYLVNYENGSFGCYEDIGSAVGSEHFKEGETITLLKDRTDVSLSVAKSYVLDLGGHTFALSKTGQIAISNGVNVTIKNGTIKTAAQDTAASLFAISAGDETTTVTFDKTLNVIASGMKDGTSSVINASAVTATTNVNVAGTWTGLKGELIAFPTSESKVTVNLSATITGAATILGVDAGTNVNVTGGNYTTDKGDTFTLKNGIVKISAGNVVAKAGNAMLIGDGATGSTYGEDLDVEITGGTFTSKTTNAILFARAYKGTYAIKGGVFTSEGKDADKKVLPAIAIIDYDFLDNQEGIITGGTFTNGVVGSVQIGESESQSAKNATAILTKGSTITEGEGSVTVGTTGTTTTPGTQTPDDETTDKNVQTYDGILSYVTLAISSLGALGFATKKVLF